MAISKNDFESIVRRHQSLLVSIAYNFFHNAQSAEEIAQDVFLQLYESLETMGSDEHVTAWLRRTATHRCIDLLRKRSNQNEKVCAELPDVVQDFEETDHFLLDRLHRLVASLPENQRAVVILRYGEDMDSEEIGQLLGMPAVTVRSHLQRALVTLRERAPRMLGRYVHGTARK